MQTMPTMATCCQCSRAFPVRSQMQAERGSLPMLVVPSEVDSMETALTQATCQVCLNTQGSVDRGLHRVLLALGVKDAVSRPNLARAMMVTPVPVVRSVSPTRNQALRAFAILPRSQVVSSINPLTGMTIDATPPPERKQRSGYEPSPLSEKRLPPALRKSERAPCDEPITPLRGMIGKSGKNEAVLQAAAEGIRERDQARRRERVQRFTSLVAQISELVGTIRQSAPTTEVWDRVDEAFALLKEAVPLDPIQGGKDSLLKDLKTSTAELEGLCLRVYEKPLIWKWNREEGYRLESLDAFEGGRRPESWDQRGGKKPSLYQFEVIRIPSKTPVPNTPLPGGDEAPRPRVVYPKDSQFGSNYTVQNSRYDPKIDTMCAQITQLYMRWFTIARDDIGIGVRLAKIDIIVYIHDFFADLRRILADMASEEVVEEVGSVVEVEVDDIKQSSERPTT